MTVNNFYLDERVLGYTVYTLPNATDMTDYFNKLYWQDIK